MLGKVFFVVLSCSLLLNPLATYARNYPCSGKKGGVSHCMDLPLYFQTSVIT